jgi:hypothetical protein
MDNENDQNDLGFEAMSGGPYPLNDSAPNTDAPAISLSTIQTSDSPVITDFSTVILTLAIDDLTESASDQLIASVHAIVTDSESQVREGPGIPPNYIGAVTSVVTSSILDVVVNLMGQSGGLLPTPPTQVTGIYVYVNGVRRDVISSMRRDGMPGGDSGDPTQLKTVRVFLAYPVQPGDEVCVSYFSTTISSDRLRDTIGNNLANFYSLSSVNQTSPVFFDLLSWLKSPQGGYDFDSSLLNSDIHELREGWPLAKTTLDTIPPIGQAIINDNPSSSGISVYWFTPFQDAAATIPVMGTTLMTDNLDLVIRRSGALGGFANDAQFETIGDTKTRSMVINFAPVNGVYPNIQAVQFCLTANTSKQYALEVRSGPNDLWAPVLTMIANPQSINYFQYQFATSGGVALAGIRLRAKGDFYSTLPTGDLTLSAYDIVSGTTSARASHFSDMRDALDFSTYADFNGWVDFVDGTSLYNWTLLNTDRIWMPFRTGGLSLALTNLGVFNSQLYMYSGPYLYMLSSSTSIPQMILTLDGAFGNITSFIVHKGVAFFGTDAGYIYRSQNGINWQLVATTNNNTPVTSFGSYKNLLYVGVSFTTPNGNGTVYTWDGTSLILIRTFNNLKVTTMTVANGLLFVGVGGNTGSLAAGVDSFNGTIWSSTLTASSDIVEVLQFADGVVWAAMSGGILYVANFDNNGNLTSWTTPPQAIDCNNFIHIREDSSFVWFVTDGGLYAYDKASLTFLQISEPPEYYGGLEAVYTESNSSNVKDVGYIIGQQASEVITSLNISSVPARYNALFSPAVTNYVNASFTGYIRAPFTGTYTFYLTASDGGRLYLGGYLSGINWTNGTAIINNWDTPVAGAVSGKADLIAGQLVPIRVEWYQTTSGVGSIRLQWSSDILAQDDIQPEFIFQSKDVAGSDTISDIAVAFAQTVGISQWTGAVYGLDASSLVTQKRQVFAEFKDGAGNTSTRTIEIANDTIFQEADRSGTSTGLGRITQVGTDKSIIASFQSSISDTLFAPDREIRDYGIYESIPYYVASLTRWDTISILGTVPAGTNVGGGLDYGTSIELYVRVGDTESDVLAKEYSLPFVKSSILPGTDVGAVSASYNIGDFDGKWLQFKVRLVTASLNVTPIINSVVLAYKAAASSFFFTSVIDSSLWSTSSPSPQWRRGLLTANLIPNGGFVQFGYTTNTDPSSTFDYSIYTPITPNTVFTLPTPNSKIRFGIMLVSLSDSYPAIVDDFAVQLEAAKSDMQIMND